MNAITTTEPAMLGFLQRAISDPDFDVQKFEVVLSAVREEQAKNAEREFYRSLAAAQGEMEPVRKDAVNPHTKSRYASFEAIDSALRPVYTRHGFCIGYRTGKTDQPGVVRMICTVAHSGGHAIEAELTAALDSSGAGGRTNKTDVQAVGSTVSYLRRYLLSMVLNVALAGDDDDGESSRRPQQPARPMNRMSSADLDQTLNGDNWDLDAPVAPKPDGARADANRIKGWLAAVTTQAQWDKLWANTGVNAVREKIRAERIELDAELTVAENEARSRISDAPPPVVDHAQAELSA